MLLNGCEDILEQRDPSLLPTRYFEDLVAKLRANWSGRLTGRWPSQKNWQLRIAPAVTSDSKGHFEKQLEKAIVSSLHPEGWGNAVPTCSGLVGPGLRQMNIDLVHRIPGGFGFIELKWKSGDPVLAATQALRYAATYMLYRLEPELMTRFSDNEMLRSTNLTFEVLAPHEYYTSKHNLETFERSINEELKTFCVSHLPSLKAQFRYTGLPKDFEFTPGMSGDLVGAAVLQRSSPFIKLRIQGSDDVVVETLEQWRIHGLPPERVGHWKPGRSACELGTSWNRSGTVCVPQEIEAMLQSHAGTRGAIIHSGFIEHETVLPFSAVGPRCHDLFLLGNCSDKSPLVLSIEAKADESFDAAIEEKIVKLSGKKSNFPTRLEWLTYYLFDESAFTDFEERILKQTYARMPYQLFAAVGSLCLEANRYGAQRAVLIVHEFRTNLTEDKKMDVNANALYDFLNQLWVRNASRRAVANFGVFEGPLTMQSGSFGGVPFPKNIYLYVGKLRTDVPAHTGAGIAHSSSVMFPLMSCSHSSKSCVVPSFLARLQARWVICRFSGP